MNILDMDDGILLHIDGPLVSYTSTITRHNAYQLPQGTLGVCLYKCGHFCKQPNMEGCCLCEIPGWDVHPVLCQLHLYLVKIGALNLTSYSLRDHMSYQTVSWP